MLNLQGALTGRRASRSERNFTLALAVSVLLHLAILLPASMPRPQRSSVIVLSATLRSPERVAAQEAAPTLPLTTAPAERAPSRRRQKIAAPRLTAPAPSAFHLPEVAALRQPQVDAQHREPAPSDTAAPEEPRASIAVPGVPATPTPAEAGRSIDEDALRQYRFALARGAVKRYPELARERQLAGVAGVRVTVSREGLARDVSLVKSSGHALLDSEAKEIIAGAARRTAVPEPLRGLEFTIDVPVLFELKEDE